MDKIIEKYIGAGRKKDVFGNLVLFEVPVGEIISVCEELHKKNSLPLKMISASDERAERGFFMLKYVFGVPGENVFLAPFILVKNDFPSLTPAIHEASIYERKIMTFFGLKPVGHPNLRTLILHENWPADKYPLRKDFNWQTRPALASNEFLFRKMDGEGVYEIPVGPVHAGIIEPGHFRFSVAGEEILMLEPRLGYSHKGSEKLFEILPIRQKIKLSERLSGDSSFSHSLAFCQAVESLAKISVFDRAKYLRVIYSELERLANHLGDIGAIMLDTGFSFGGVPCARLREVVMMLNDELTGSRFLRGVNAAGGVLKDISQDAKEKIAGVLNKLNSEFLEIIGFAENSSSLLNRLEDTGVLDRKIALDHGVLGVAARAVGIPRDARADYPYAAYGDLRPEVAVLTPGDVYSRFKVRVKEVQSSIGLGKDALSRMPAGEIMTKGADGAIVFEKGRCALGVVEGWRGDIVYLVSTDGRGEISRVDVRDPSFLNWTVLGYAGKGNVVPDFPLINKSFNLSYSGNDL